MDRGSLLLQSIHFQPKSQSISMMLKLYLTLSKKYRIFVHPMNTAARKSSILLDSPPFSFHGSDPFILGVTGGIGSGKSLFCHTLADSGVAVIEADTLTRTLHADPDIQNRIRRKFGDGVYHDGVLDRKRLAELVFTDFNRLAALDAILLPLLEKRILSEITRLSKDHAMVVVDMANLYSSGLDEHCDAVVRIQAPLARRRAWLRERGLTDQAIKDRIRSQRRLPRGNPDLIVDNDGTVDELAKKARRLMTRLESSIQNRRSLHERTAK
jgi:dephospho-CoA kinase